MKSSQTKIETSTPNEETQFGATTHTTHNREEVKMKMLLTGSYDYIHRETGKMIHKKFYKKAFQLLEKFYASRKDLELAESIQLNRRILTCINKILKMHLIKPELEWEPEVILMNIVTRGIVAINEIYKYLNIFVQKVLPAEENFIMLDDVSHLSDFSIEQTDIIQQKPPKTRSIMINQYRDDLIKRALQQKPVGQQKIDHNDSESDRIAEMIQRSEKLLNIQFELEQLWYNTTELMLRCALIYKQSSKVKLAFYYIYEADRICRVLQNSQNPGLINLCAQTKITLANFLMETQQYDKALKEIDECLVLLSGEMRIRLNSEKFVTKFKTNREKRRTKKCAKTVLSAMMTMVVIYESQGLFHEMMDALQTASWFAEKFVQGIDEFKKYVIKLQIEGRNRLEMFLIDVADLSYIAQQALEQELFDLLRRQRDKKSPFQNDYLQLFHEEMYKLFQFKDLNQQQYHLFQNKQQVTLTQGRTTSQTTFKQENIQRSSETQIANFKSHQPQDSQGQVNMGTEISMNIDDTDSDTDNESFFDASFFAPSQDNFLFDTEQFEDNKQKKTKPGRKLIVKKNIKIKTDQKAEVPQTDKNGQLVMRQRLNPPTKSVGLIKIGGERHLDHKSAILTTNEYFKPLQKKEKQIEYIKVDPSKHQKQLENIEYRLHPERTKNNKQDLDTYVKKKVEEQLGSGGINKYEDVKTDLLHQRKLEDFDKKEFNFGRKILCLQRNSGLLQHSHQQQTVPVPIEIDTLVKNEGTNIEERMKIEYDLKELKKRKIDNMIASKKKLQQEVQITLKDPEETTYFKKALEKNKKKKLKDLIYQHQHALGLTKFFTHLIREQKEQERQQKLLQAERERAEQKEKDFHEQQEQLKSALRKEDPFSPIKKPKVKEEVKQKHVRIIEGVVDEKQEKQQIQDLKTKQKKTVLKTSQEKKQNEEDEDLSGTRYLLYLAQQQEKKRQQQEIIEKYQKQAFNVNSLIVDGVEKKIDLDRKQLKRLVFQKERNLEYVDEDEITYLKFMNEKNELCRSTHLLKIKRELNEKQFTFEEIVLMKYQMNKQKQQVTSGDTNNAIYQRIGKN